MLLSKIDPYCSGVLKIREPFPVYHTSLPHFRQLHRHLEISVSRNNPAGFVYSELEYNDSLLCRKQTFFFTRIRVERVNYALKVCRDSLVCHIQAQAQLFGIRYT